MAHESRPASQSAFGRSSLGWLGCGILQQAPQCPKGVLHADFLAFLVCSPAVAYADFVDSQLSLRNLHRNLGFESEASFPQRDGLQSLPPKSLVTGFHVGKVQVGEAVGEQRQKL